MLKSLYRYAEPRSDDDGVPADIVPMFLREGHRTTSWWLWLAMTHSFKEA